MAKNKSIPIAQNLREVSAAPLLAEADGFTSGQRAWGYVFAAIGAAFLP